MASQPHGLDAPHYYNPTEYNITEILVFKRRFLIMKDLSLGFSINLQRGLPAEPDFLIAIDRNIDLPRKPIFSSAKLAIDQVNYSLVHPAAPGPLQRTFRCPIVWRMPDPEANYAFNLNLSQVGILLKTIERWNPNPEYHALHKNSFWHSAVMRTMICYIIQDQQLLINNATVDTEEPHQWDVTLGKCFGIRLDAEDQGEATAIMCVAIETYDSSLSPPYTNAAPFLTFLAHVFPVFSSHSASTRHSIVICHCLDLACPDTLA